VKETVVVTAAATEENPTQLRSANPPDWRSGRRSGMRSVAVHPSAGEMEGGIEGRCGWNVKWW